MSDSSAPDLNEVVKAHKVLVICGTGGVGKTTVSASIALGAALAGQRVLVMTIDPAKRLADSLGVVGKLNEATPIDLRAALGDDVELSEGGSLHAMMLDAKGTWDDTVRRFAKSQDTQDRIFNNNYYQRASESLSGSQEYMAMERLLEMHATEAYDLVVLDTPPTRNALDFLEAPDRLMAVLEEGILGWLIPKKRGRFSPVAAGARLFGRGREAMFNVLERFMGADVIRGLADFISAMSELLDGMRSRAGEVMELLRSEDCAFLMVAAPNRIALSEGLYFHDRLAEAGIPFRGFVINRVRPAFGEGKTPATPWESNWTRSGEATYDAAVEQVWDEHRRRTRWAHVDRHHINALKAHCGPTLPYVEIPELEGEIHDLDALRLLLAYLE
ncbi:MAG: ArsA family ATPase [Deltaproteobacteria bacterium]|nr:ArsA family ATPase [Deltaproteobacteria bacterium]